MKNRDRVFKPNILLFIFLVFLQATSAQELRMDKKLRQETVNQIAQILNNKYVIPEIAKKYSNQIVKQLENGEYKNIVDPMEFAEKITNEIKAVQDDQHFQIRYDPGAVQNMRYGNEISESERETNRARQLRNEKRRNYGFKELKILPGNIGYLKLNEFASERASETAIAAMNFLTHSDAVIFDIRDNGGGSNDMIEIIGSYLFSNDYPREFSSIYNRITDKLLTYKTQAYVPGKRLVNTDLYILVSNSTFSAAEAFAYDLKHMKRAKIVGERTSGGAHSARTFIINDHFVIDLPFARAISPITKTNWEGTGVEPDIICEADDALQTAQSIILARIVEENPDEYSLNNLGYSLLGNKDFDLAIEIFIMNAEIHPLSANAYDSLGEAYMNAGEIELAILNYEKSLILNPNSENAKKMLKQLAKE